MIWVLVVLIAIFIPAAVSGILAAPFVPTWGKDLEAIVEIIPQKRGIKFVELGDGIGTVALFVAKRRPDVSVVGWGIQPLLFLIAYLRARQANCQILWGDFFRQDLSGADIVFLYWTAKTTYKVEKLNLRKNIMIISYAFPIPGKKPKRLIQRLGRLPIFVYSI